MDTRRMGERTNNRAALPAKRVLGFRAWRYAPPRDDS